MENSLNDIESSNNYNNFIKLRGKSYLDMEKRYEKLKTQLRITKPHARSLCYLKSEKDLELHLTLFEAYRISPSIYLKSLVKKISPSSPEIQVLLVELLPCLDIIIGSTVQASFGFPLLVAGMSCILDSDRSLIEAKVTNMSKNFPVKTFQRILVII